MNPEHQKTKCIAALELALIECQAKTWADAKHKARRIAERAGCTHSGCDQDWHSKYCPLGIAQRIEEMEP